MQIPQWVTDLFQGIDRMDMNAFMKPIGENASFCFGNAPAAVGREAIYQGVQGFFASIKGISHTLLEAWENPDSVVCQGRVTYTRHDDTQLTLPFVNVFKMDGDKVKEYLIYIDINPLYNPQA